MFRGTASLLALTLLVAGCGSTEQTAEREPVATQASSTAETPTGPAAAYAGWLSALARRDAARACEHHAPEFTIALRDRAILEHRAEAGDPCTGFVAILWEDPAFESEIVDIAVTQETAEDAVLGVTLTGSAQTVRMVHHRAAWRVSTVARRASASGDVNRWLNAWCDVGPAMSREEIVRLMGAPSGEYTVSDGGEPQLWWARDQYDFRVYLDAGGSVLELVGDYDALDAADRKRLDCPELR